MKRLPRSIHRTLVVIHKEELVDKPYFFGLPVRSPRIHHHNKLKLLKRGYVKRECRKVENGWTIRLWISEKGIKYLSEVQS